MVGHQRTSWIISVVEVRLREAKGQKFLLVQIRISAGPRKALFGVETEHLGKIPCVFVDRILDELNGLLNLRLSLRFFFNFGLHFRLNFRLFLLFAGVEVIDPSICLLLPFLLDDLTFFSELLIIFTIEVSLYDIEPLMEKIFQRRRWVI